MRYRAEEVTSGMIESVWQYKPLLCVAYDGEMYFVAARREFTAENGWFRREPVVEILSSGDLECIDPATDWSEPAAGAVKTLLSQLNSAESRILHVKEFALKLDNLLLLQSA